MNNNDEKIDKILEKISDIDVTLAKQEVSLATHIKRTEMLEERVAPLEKHVIMFSGAVKLVLFISALAAIAEVFMRT